mmetsp:Transcript_33620/g.106906  ORF Transcript_33620/g.106906 Transcript_33620/m.106906 type:complete len:228 (+) Transcript_33620:539-1222(+)
MVSDNHSAVPRECALCACSFQVGRSGTSLKQVPERAVGGEPVDKKKLARRYPRGQVCPGMPGLPLFVLARCCDCIHCLCCLPRRVVNCCSWPRCREPSLGAAAHGGKQAFGRAPVRCPPWGKRCRLTLGQGEELLAITWRGAAGRRRCTGLHRWPIVHGLQFFRVHRGPREANAWAEAGFQAIRRVAGRGPHHILRRGLIARPGVETPTTCLFISSARMVLWVSTHR